MDYPTNTINAPIAPLWAIDIPDKPLEWFYPSVFVRGELNGIQGVTGDGKTWLMCELSAQTSVGGIVQGVLDENDVAELPQGNVLYFAGDDSPERLKERMTTCGADMSKVAFQPDGILPQIGSPEMEQLFDKTKPALCIIDTLQHFIGNASANDMTAMTVALQPLQRLARRYRSTVVVIMHVSKFAANGNGGDSTAFSIGSYAIAGIFRTLWTLGRLKDADGRATPLRALCQSKNNYAEFDPPALLFELRNGFHWKGVDTSITAEDLYNKKKNKGRPASMRDSVKDEILGLLGGGEPVLSAELERKVCEITGCHQKPSRARRRNWALKVSSPSGNGFAPCPVRR